MDDKNDDGVRGESDRFGSMATESGRFIRSMRERFGAQDREIKESIRYALHLNREGERD